MEDAALAPFEIDKATLLEKVRQMKSATHYDIEIETENVLKNLEAILKADGLGFNNIIKTTVYLTDLSEFARMNQVYEKFFAETKPARACVQVAALPKGAKVEIDAVAHS